MRIKGLQIKVARVAAGLTHKELAEQANIAISTLRRVEVEEEITNARVETLTRLILTLEKHGIKISKEGEKLVWEKNI